MKKVFFNILPMLAIVAGIAGAFGFDAQQDPCLNPSLTGYTLDVPRDNPPGSPTIPYEIDGVYGTNYTCNAAIPTDCRYVFGTPTGETSPRWVLCPGMFVELGNP